MASAYAGVSSWSATRSASIAAIPFAASAPGFDSISRFHDRTVIVSATGSGGDDHSSPPARTMTRTTTPSAISRVHAAAAPARSEPTIARTARIPAATIRWSSNTPASGNGPVCAWSSCWATTASTRAAAIAARTVARITSGNARAPRAVTRSLGRRISGQRRPLGQQLDELDAEPALHAQVAVGDAGVEGREHLHDPLVLHVQRQRADDPAVGADRVGDGLPRLVPRARLAELVLGAEHQRARRAHVDAVAAVDARGLRQRDVELGGDAGVESAPGDGDGERVLGVRATRLDALVAEDAARVVPHVQGVVDLDRLVDGLRRPHRPIRVVVVTRLP